MALGRPCNIPRQEEASLLSGLVPVSKVPLGISSEHASASAAPFSWSSTMAATADAATKGTANVASPQPHRFKRSDFLDSHKAVTPLAILAMMAFYGQWHNYTAWIYLATHGTYALLWVYKGFTFPDKQFLVPCSIPYGVAYVWFPLTLYWIAGWLVMSRGVEAPPWYLAMCVSLSSTGIFFHYVGDMQKHMHMQYRKGTLLTEGVWSGCRNPNYFGELLIYLGFGLLAMHWLPMTILGAMVFGLWFPNMRLKDKSMSRYPEFAAWKARTGRLVPYLF